MNIILPEKKHQSEPNLELNFEQLVVIGANGSGKTRFGSSIEERYGSLTRRISAHKSLSMPKFVNTTSKNNAVGNFLYGGWDENDGDWYSTAGKTQMRWGNNPSTYLLDDYEALMVLLQTSEFEEAIDYMQNDGDKPITKIDRIQTIWEYVLPHRRLSKGAGIIEAYPTEDKSRAYNSSEMSDGERVIFYLIGQVICAPEGSMIIIDEPELHINKSIFKNLFDKIENERPDCSFIYLTHDIDFAVSRQNADKIWVKSYDGKVWDYEVLDDETPIPELLYLEVLGSRKPVLFIEGDNTSIDYQLYQQVFLDKYIKPLGSCGKVISTVNALNDQSNIHRLRANGLIDRDRRTNEDIEHLVRNDVWVLNVAEVENLLLIEPIVKAVAQHMNKNPDEVFNLIKTNLMRFFHKELENQVLIHFKKYLEQKMINVSNFKQKKILEALEEVDRLYAEVDKQTIFDDIKNRFENIHSSDDYEELLKVFNLKNALIPNSKLCEIIGLRSKDAYLDMVISLLKKMDETSSLMVDGIKRSIVTS